MEERQRISKKLPEIFLWILYAVIIAILIILCFDNGIDFDEAYSYRTAYENDTIGVFEEVLTCNDVDLPLYYLLLHYWMNVFGNSWFACRMLSVLGAGLTMLLGATYVKKNWGYMTACLFMLLIGFCPAMVHINVNIRPYPWTIFMTAACALTAHSILNKPDLKKWILLFALTETAFFTHYYASFGFFLIYLYLMIGLYFVDKSQIWKIITIGVVSSSSMLAFAIAKNMGQFIETGNAEVSAGKIVPADALRYAFHTDIHWSSLMGLIITVTIFLAGIFLYFRQKEEKRTWIFALFCMSAYPVSYLLAGCVSMIAAHFYTPRHVVSSLGLLWLGIAIIVPSISKRVYVCVMVFVLVMAESAYINEFKESHRNIPYLEETVKFIDENMLPGDVVIYNAEAKFDLLYGCYMPKQEFYHISEVTDIGDFADERVWFFMCTQDPLSDEALEGYDISTDYMGHYGFQIINNCTDFDLLYVDIERAGE